MSITIALPAPLFAALRQGAEEQGQTVEQAVAERIERRYIAAQSLFRLLPWDQFGKAMIAGRDTNLE